MKLFLIVLALPLELVFLPNTTQAAPFDSGFIQWSQPNSTTFVARAWGDEFFWWMETSNGYRIIQGSGGWYYYATLDSSGEYTPTSARVAIDSPPSGSYKLERSATRFAVIEQWIAQANNQTEQARQWFGLKQAANPGAPVVLRIGVIFAEFQDVPHYSSGTRPNGYFKADFDSMMFSQKYWYAPAESLQYSSPHPEEDRLYGSMRDYYWQMSRGRLALQGTLLNPPNVNGVPRWVKIGNRANYRYPAHMKPDAMKSYMDSLHANPSGQWPDTSGYDRFIIVYAQNDIPGSSFTHAGDRTFIQVPERAGVELINPQQVAFAHMGTYAHEFGHNIGFDDEYYSRGASGSNAGQTCLFRYDLMAWGIYNGPNLKGECPATLSPYYRIQKGWLTPIQVWFNTTNLEVPYNYNDPQVYRIDPSGAADGEHYLFETRLRQGFDRYIPTSPDSLQYQPGTLLVWHQNINNVCINDNVRLVHADNTREWGSFLTDFFPSNAVTNFQSLNDRSTPAATLGANYPNPECRDERPAHFALNGIHKLSNGNTLIDTVSLYYKYVSIPVANAWHMLSVPVTLGNYLKPAVFPGATSAAFVYVSGSGYVQRDTLKNGPGYFIKFGATGSLVLGGNVRETDTAFVSANWNLVGSITDTIDTANVCLYPYPSNKRLTPFYRYENGYVPDSLIVPGRGYWVKVLLDGEFVFHHDPVECGGGGIDFATSEFDHFIITDAEGRKQDVYVANLNRDPSLAQIDLSMPPPFPDAEFDARFEAGEFVKTVSPDSGVVELTINVETEAYPVTVTWELNPENGIEYSINTEGMGKKQGSASLTRSGSSVMTSSSGGKFRLNAEVTGHGSKDVLPTAYMLAQNYPNPFNPSTQIHYELPHDGQVRLVVYDVLGREVTTLVNDMKVAGRYDASFSTSGLASGVYFYRLQAGSFVNTRKMLLLR